MELIDKSALAAEIEERIKECDKLADAAADNNLSNTQQANELLIRQYTSLLHFLDTLETKEVEESVSNDLNIAAREYSLIEGAENIDEYAQYDFKKYNSFKDGAKWQKEMIELGLKVQKGE